MSGSGGDFHDLTEIVGREAWVAWTGVVARETKKHLTRTLLHTRLLPTAARTACARQDSKNGEERRGEERRAQVEDRRMHGRAGKWVGKGKGKGKRKRKPFDQGNVAWLTAQ